MVTYQDWLKKFPQFVAVCETLFDEKLFEAKIEMGDNPYRWINPDVYVIAQGYLIAHLAALDESWVTGDHSVIQPYRTKQVDDVMIEHAVSRNMQNNFDPYTATSYGQQYLKWRRMAFAGPRVV